MNYKIIIVAVIIIVFLYILFKDNITEGFYMDITGNFRSLFDNIVIYRNTPQTLGITRCWDDCKPDKNGKRKCSCVENGQTGISERFDFNDPNTI